MSMHLMREIDKLKRQVLSLSAVVEENVRRAVASLQQGDEALARQAIGIDLEIDQTEIDVEEECLKILALHQPVAIDLRLIIACLKINNDLERIGDLAVRIAKRVIDLLQGRRPQIPPELPLMADKAQAMLAKSLDALVGLDADLAREVLPADDEVDDMHRAVGARVEAQILDSPESLHGLLHIFTISRCLERIADHATNIAEDVVYMLEGEIVRHGGGPAAPGQP